MHAVKIVIVEWVDDYQPGVVKCSMNDAWGGSWSFVEKVPTVTAADLSRHSTYPQPGTIACEIVRRWRDGANREVVTVDMERPWHVEATTGESIFDVLPEQLMEL
jgi:hypothetical protein